MGLYYLVSDVLLRDDCRFVQLETYIYHELFPDAVIFSFISFSPCVIDVRAADPEVAALASSILANRVVHVNEVQYSTAP